MIADRSEVTRMILSAKVAGDLSWKEVAKAVGQSKEWTTAACLGQMAMTAEQAKAVGDVFGLTEEAVAWLQQVPYKAGDRDTQAADPLIYRLYEAVHVYGGAIKALIHEEFGDGIMSAIDFDLDIQRQEDPKGDRVRILMTGKFLPYKTF